MIFDVLTQQLCRQLPRLQARQQRFQQFVQQQHHQTQRLLTKSSIRMAFATSWCECGNVNTLLDVDPPDLASAELAALWLAAAAAAAAAAAKNHNTE
jgi:hypothetical protein